MNHPMILYYVVPECFHGFKMFLRQHAIRTAVLKVIVE
jgi:hypothetical protein